MKSKLLIALFAMSALVACGKKNPDSSQQYNNIMANGSACQPGYVNTQYGQLPQGNCPVGQGYHPQIGQCVQGTPCNGNYIGNQPGYGNYPGACGSGSVMTQYGCLQQGPCPAGSGQYYNTCVPANYNYNGGGYGGGGGYGYWH